MYAIKIGVSSKDFDDFIKSRLDEEDAQRFADCEWVPSKVCVTDYLEIEVTAVPSKVFMEVELEEE